MRPAHFAGTWYPGTEAACRHAVEQLVEQADTTPDPGCIAGIVPHAGWAYSGPAAAEVFAGLMGQEPDLVVVFGGHLGNTDRHTLMLEGAWQTPLGSLPIAKDVAADVHATGPFAVETEEKHRRDNAIELELPLVRYCFPGTSLLPVGVAPTADAERVGRQVAQVIADRGRTALFFGSTDLTHYGPNYGWAPQGRGEAAVRWVKEHNDAGVIQAMMALDPAGTRRHAVEHRSACCPGAAAATIAAARLHGVTHGTLGSYYTSHDVRPADSFVGYAGILFRPTR